MRRYIEHMRQKDPHERRTHALRVASVVTGAVFVVWVATLGARLAGPSQEVALEGDQTAAVVQAQPKTGPHLEVSTTSVFLPQYQQ
jgi:hypothetical protein